LSWDPATTSIEQLGERIAALGYRPRPVEAAPTWDRDLVTRLGVSAFFASNVMLMAVSVYTGWSSGMDERFAALFRWGSLALSTPVALWCAVPFYRAGWQGLRVGVLHMDLPISIAVVTLYTHGVVATLLGQDGYLDSLGMLVTLLLAGRVLEARGRRAAAQAAATLAAQMPTTARRATADGVETVSVERLVAGDIVEIGLGEEVPADGTVVGGSAQVRLAVLTGESEPVRVGVGDEVVAGAPVLAGTLRVRVERVGDETLPRRMAREVLMSMDRPLLAAPTDKLAPLFTVGTLLAATAAVTGWGMTHGAARGVEVMAAVLVVACPCALGLSWPIAVSAGLAALARRGVVLRSGDALQRLVDIDLVALDKTGTVTGGVPVVVAADDAILRVASGLERASSHPIAAAIRSAAASRKLPMPVAEELEEVPGVGVRGVVDGRRWRIVSGEAGQLRVERLTEGGEVDLVGLIGMRDVRRDDAPDAVRALGLPVVLLTGDHEAVAERLGAEIGATEVHARMTPEGKAAWIAARQAEGRKVLFVGDGLNDGPALVTAHVGLAMKAGAAASLLAADGVVVHDALGPVVAALRGARVVRAVVRGNMARSVVYNVVAVGFAAAGYVNPLVAAVLMPLSSLMVLWGGTRVEPRLARGAA
ncbi:MAG: heavy metal translocating P-type ATPase, partial [Myxococcales bacterium]|nr:heavy metal translocating P-type ATPase [Myxococcales bacterium]